MERSNTFRSKKKNATPMDLKFKKQQMIGDLS